MHVSVSPQRGLRSERQAKLASTSRVDWPRTNPAITNASSALVRMTWVAEQLGGEALVGAARFRALQDQWPLVVLAVMGWWPLR
jgi:hypothetical protein